MLLASLGPCAEDYFVCESSQKEDLSYASPRSVTAKSREAGRKRKRSAWEYSEIQSLLALKEKSLISFLAIYIAYLDPIQQDSRNDGSFWTVDQKRRKDVLEVFNHANLTWLRERGYRIADLTAWRWILSAYSSETAIARLIVLANTRIHAYQAGRIPVFLILFLLRRRYFNDRAFRMIFTFIWNRLLEQDLWEKHIMAGTVAGDPSANASTGLSEHLVFRPGSVIVLVIRLLRRAREVWPAALPSISAIATRYLSQPKKTKRSVLDTSTDVNHRNLAAIFNSLLHLLSLPSSKQPFLSIIYHERAQFSIIRRMTEFEPPLTLNRKAYRAVTQVQIARRKTVPEREWATLKLRSWPPWKGSRSGIDIDIGVERGISRAAEAIMRSQEAGYAEQGWDAMAKVFAGWDTDNSPTIQTRAVVPKADSSWPLSYSCADSDVEPDVRLWYARIKATRTASEAWACFLSYRDTQQRLKKRYSQFPYFAMFEKIIFEEKRLRHGDNRSANLYAEIWEERERRPLPGDGKETWPDPGPQEAVYIRTPVPNSHEFFKLLTTDGIVPGGRFLEFLLHHATTLQQGVKFLRASCLPRTTREAFFKGITTAELCAVDIKIFTAYIHCLCRHAFPPLDPDSQSRKSMPILYAFQLMEKRKPCYWPPWNFLMSALRREGAVVDTHFYGRNVLVQDATAWSVMLYWLNQIRGIGLDLQFGCFHSLCIGLEKSTLASQKLLQILNRGAFVDDCGLEGFTPAGQQILQLIERGPSGSLEKSALATWELLRKLPYGAFRRVESPVAAANLLGKLARGRPRKFSLLRHTFERDMANDPATHRTSFNDTHEVAKTSDRVIRRYESRSKLHGNEKLLRSRPKNLARIRYNAEHIVANGPGILKACFDELVGATKASDRAVSPELRGNSGTDDFNSITLIPRLLAVPRPVHLHAFIRVLGLHHDYDWILKIVQWMDRFADELYHQSMESMSDGGAMRTLLTAIRVFLEGKWPTDDDPAKDGCGPADEANMSAPPDTIQQAFDIINRQELWGGWPSDDEVEFYITNGKSPPDYSEECRRFEATCQDQPLHTRLRSFRKEYT